MQIKERQLSERALTYLFALTYMVSYITRKNFGAVISEIALDTGIERTLLSLSLTGSFITYGIAQIISGIVGDKLSPKKLVLFGLIITVITNLALPIVPNPYFMVVIWSINGFGQAFLWPPLVRLMLAYMSTEGYKRAVVTVSCGSSIGTVIVFLLSPIIIALTSWRGVFLAAAAVGILMCIVWQSFSPDVEKTEIKKTDMQEEKKSSGLLSFGFILLLFATATMGMLREGVETWMPSYIYDTFDMSNVIAILLGVLLPVFAVISLKIWGLVYEKKFSSPALLSGIIYAIASLAAILLLIITGKNAFGSIILMALISGCMHGVSLMLTGMAPPIFAGEGRVSTVSGIINSSTYVGSAVSTYLVAAFSESRGWSFTVFIWLLMIIFGAITSFGAAVLNNKKKRG